MDADGEASCRYATRPFFGRATPRHPRDMGKREVEEFLTWLARDGDVAPSTQDQAFSALVFMSGTGWELMGRG